MSRPLELPWSADPDVAIVVLATRNAERLEQCLQAILAAGFDDLAVRIVLCANAADPDVAGLVDSATGAVVVRSNFDLGTAAPWNLGVAAQPAPRFAIVHEDAFVTPGWLGALSEQLDAHPTVAVVGPTMLWPDGEILSQGNVLWREGWPSRISPGTVAGLELRSVTPVDFVNSATMLADRSLWEEVNGFDEGTFPGTWVETDFSTAAWASGRRVIVLPTVQSVHEVGASLVEGAGWRYTRNLPRLPVRTERLALRETLGRTPCRSSPTPDQAA